jgi:hypothetical protein
MAEREAGKGSEETEKGVSSLEKLAESVNLSTSENPFEIDIDAILDAIPAERRGKKYTEGWDPERLDEVSLSYLLR